MIIRHGTAEGKPTLSRLDEDLDKALAIVAHPDDLEHGAASVIAQWSVTGRSLGREP